MISPGSAVASIACALAIMLTGAMAVSMPEVAIPEPTGYVNDFAGVLDAATVKRLEDRARALYERTSAELAIVTVGTAAPLEISDYAVAVFERWKIGARGRDNGVLMLVSVSDRRVWLSVGYGLEAALPDAMAAAIAADVVVPHLRRGAWGPGVLAGVDAITAALGRMPAPAGAGGQQPLMNWRLLGVLAPLLGVFLIPLGLRLAWPSAPDRARLCGAIAIVACVVALLEQATGLTTAGRLLTFGAGIVAVLLLYRHRHRLFSRRERRRDSGEGPDFPGGSSGSGRSLDLERAAAAGFAGFHGGETGGAGAGDEWDADA